jgi:hypothetical protein
MDSYSLYNWYNDYDTAKRLKSEGGFS